MQCLYCFAEIPDNSVNCPECGKQVTIQRDLAQSSEPAQVLPPSGFSGTAAEGEPEEPLSVMESLMRPFKDPLFTKKWVIGSLWSLIPIVNGIYMLGYQVEYIRKIIRRDGSKVLPSPDDFGENLSRGIIPFVISLIYSAIIGIIAFIVMIPFMGTLIKIIVNAFKSGKEPTPGEIMTGCMNLIIPIIIIGIICIIYMLIMPMIIILYARRSEFRDAFNVGRAIKIIMSDLGGYLILLLYLIGFAMIAAIGLGFLSILNAIPILGQLAYYVASTFVSFGMGLCAMSAFSEFFYKNRRVIQTEE